MLHGAQHGGRALSGKKKTVFSLSKNVFKNVRRTSEATGLAVPVAVLCVSDETVLDPLFSTVSRPFRTVFRGLGAGFWNLGGKTAKQRGKNDVNGREMS